MRLVSALALSAAALSTTASASYSLVDHHEGSSFFDGWDFFSGNDPTHGFVTYLDRNTAQNQGLVSTTSNQAYIGVDSWSTLDPNGPGRASVRLTSQKSYNNGLFIADIPKMPGSPGGTSVTSGGICGTWPAFWLVGPNWPNNGEIDIIEGINSNSDNTFVAHTSKGCTFDNQDSTVMRGKFDTTFGLDCSLGGCGGAFNYQWSYGEQHNAVAGGVWAMELKSDSIKIWYWPRIWIPQDIKDGQPKPDTWTDLPFAVWSGAGCDISQHFQQMQMVINTDFCGDWAGNSWGWDSHWYVSYFKCIMLGISLLTCISPVSSAKASSCNAYVAQNPSDFAQASWQINYVSVYQQ